MSAHALSSLQSKLFPKSSPTLMKARMRKARALHAHKQVAEILKKRRQLILNDDQIVSVYVHFQV